MSPDSYLSENTEVETESDLKENKMQEIKQRIEDLKARVSSALVHL